MFRNTATKFTVWAWDTANNAWKTGDSANITIYYSLDGATPVAVTDTSATELDATHMPGAYAFDAAAAETNGSEVIVGGKSTTANIIIVPTKYKTDDLTKMGVADYGTSQAIGATTMTAQSSAPTCVTTNSSSIGKTILLTNGANMGATARVTSNVGSTKVLTFSGGWSNGATPTGTPTYVLFDTAPDSAISTGLLTLAKLEAAFVSSGVFSTASMANVKTTELTAIAAQLSNLQTRTVAALTAQGNVPADVQAVLGDTLSTTGVSSDNSGVYTV